MPGAATRIGELAGTPSCYLLEIQCGDEPEWSGPPLKHPALVFCRSGGFMRTVGRAEEFIDPTMGYLIAPSVESVADHPLGTGDVSTMMILHHECYADLADQISLYTGFRISAGLEVAHRHLVARCRLGDQFEIEELLATLLCAIPPTTERRPISPRPATDVARRRLVTSTREILRSGHFDLGLELLAQKVSCSPHHLSRVFRQVTGMTVSAYRNRLRVSAVLDDLQQDAGPLRELAAMYGFSDQAHLSRIVRQHTGLSPSGIKELLRPASLPLDDQGPSEHESSSRTAPWPSTMA